VAESELFLTRVRDLEKLVIRTAERRSGRPFRERGRPGRVAREIEVFLTAPRAASFAVSFRIGHSEQTSFPGISLGDAVIKEIFDCFELLNSNRRDALDARIPDLAYRRNFMSLARSIAPDGQAVRTVGFTAHSDTGERRLILSRPLGDDLTDLVAPTGDTTAATVVVRGTLKFADKRREDRSEIRIVEDSGRGHTIRVPPGLMDDIVRPLWDQKVVVSGVREGRAIRLEDIRRVEEAV
jgi:hypothetical protein